MVVWQGQGPDRAIWAHAAPQKRYPLLAGFALETFRFQGRPNQRLNIIFR